MATSKARAGKARSKKSSKRAAKSSRPKVAAAKSSGAKRSAVSKSRKGAKPAPIAKPAPVVALASKPKHAMPYTTRSKILERSGQMVPDSPQARADHEHQDPRLVGGLIGEEGRKVQPVNYGQFKNKTVARNDKPVNWFRRGAKPAQK